MLHDYDFIIVISGSRDATLQQCDRYVLPELEKIAGQCLAGASVLLIHGDCHGRSRSKPGGVDYYVREWIERERVNLPTLDEHREPYPDGKGIVGGPFRNRGMVAMARGYAVMMKAKAWCLAFPEAGKPCKGTRGMIKLCRQYGLPVREIEMEVK